MTTHGSDTGVVADSRKRPALTDEEPLSPLRKRTHEGDEQLSKVLPPSLAELPRLPLERLLAFLPIPDRGNIRATCKRVNTLALRSRVPLRHAVIHACGPSHLIGGGKMVIFSMLMPEGPAAFTIHMNFSERCLVILEDDRTKTLAELDQQGVWAKMVARTKRHTGQQLSSLLKRLCAAAVLDIDGFCDLGMLSWRSTDCLRSARAFGRVSVTDCYEPFFLTYLGGGRRIAKLRLETFGDARDDEGPLAEWMLESARASGALLHLYAACPTTLRPSTMTALARLMHLRLYGSHTLSAAALRAYFEAFDPAVVKSSFAVVTHALDEEELKQLFERIEMFEGRVTIHINGIRMCIRYGDFFDEVDAQDFQKMMQF